MLHVPVSLLRNPDQTASAKVLWMAQRLNPTAGPAELEAKTSLSRHTVLAGLAQVTALNRFRSGPRVQIPGELLAEPAVGAPAKVLYGLLQVTPKFRGHSGESTYTSLCTDAHLSRNTLKRAMAELAGAGWLRTTQKHQFRPIHFTLGTPQLRRALAEAALAKRRLKRAQYGGEAIMQEYLTLLIDSKEFTDNARPGWLVNPQTGERLELDRFYPPGFAVEFNGAQHYRETGRFTQEEAEEQHFRDVVKAGVCLYEGIHLVIIHPEDLSLQGIARKIGRAMPLRNLAGHEPLIELLEEASLKYCAATPAPRPSVG
jgi:hypothetical protein